MKIIQLFKSVMRTILDFLAIMATITLIIIQKVFGLFLFFFINFFLLAIIYPESFRDLIELISLVFQNYGLYILLFFVLLFASRLIIEIRNIINKNP